jgi:hypothetical protein
MERPAMKICSSILAAILFGVLLASPSSAQDIVGAWSRGDTTTKGSSVIIFFANGTFIDIEGTTISGAPAAFGGSYGWDPSSGALTITPSQAHDGTVGVG